MKTATAVFDEIVQHAGKHSDGTTKHVPVLKLGEWVAQGDVNFVALSKVPDRARPTAPVSQLAPGNTRGSRHCIKREDLGKVEFFALPYPNPLQGVILKINAPIIVEHPEHGDHVWYKGAIVLVTFQRKYAEELRRIED
jgi:hypothetical protein